MSVYKVIATIFFTAFCTVIAMQSPESSKELIYFTGLIVGYLSADLLLR